MTTRGGCERRDASNSTFDRTAGSHSLAAAGQRERFGGLRDLEWLKRMHDTRAPV